jgi:fructose-1,6-bisphosphatase/inositol monophosphatase family enzyme
MPTPLPDHPLLAAVQALHRRIRRDIVRTCDEASVITLSGVARDDEGDTLYAIDRVAEDLLIEEVGRTIASATTPVVLVAEGLPGGEVVLPEGADRAAARWVIIVDPIDGTRGLMYQKRPAWILTGVAPGPGPRTLAEIELAVQTEIPLVKQHLCDEIWAVRGQGASGLRFNRLTGEYRPLALQPSTATTIEHGFATIARFFPGHRAELGAIDDEVVSALLGAPQPGKAQAFEDQYISSGGQLYELMAGHDRFVADLRPLFERRRATGAALCCHPYDVCTELIARSLGVAVTDERGKPLDAPLDVTSDVSWIGYANPALKARIEPHLQRAMSRRGLMD